MSNDFNLLPWGLHPLPSWIETEIYGRSKEYGGSGKALKTAWVRFFSNGVSKKNDGLDGFMMGGIHGFSDSYGFNEGGKIALGLDANGRTHYIENSNSSFPHRPPPAIESVETSLYGGQNSGLSGMCKKTTVNWKCYSLDQLEYLTPYFLTPKVTALLEWGWPTDSAIQQLIDVRVPGDILSFLDDGRILRDKIEKSSGNYDGSIGFIFDYGFSLNSLGGYDCYTSFVNTNWLFEGTDYRNRKTIEGNTTSDFQKFINDNLNSICTKDQDLIRSLSEEYELEISNRTFSTKGGTIKGGGTATNEVKNWISMGLFIDIINKHFSMELRTSEQSDSNSVESIILNVDIDDVKINAHPALKSTNIDILIPNQFAPKFVSGSFDSDGIGTSESSEHKEIFERTGISSIIDKRGFTKQLDNLKEIINPNGNSFPVYKKDLNVATGMWGYLKDIFISTDIVRRTVSSNESALRMLETVCGQINSACSGIVQLKVIALEDGGINIQDMNYNPNSTAESIKKLLRLIPGSVNSGSLLNASLEVKLSPEMANQMVALSSSGKASDDTTTFSNRFVGTDRLYSATNTIETSIERRVPNTSSPRTISNDFITYTKDNKEYILVDPHPDFLKYVLYSDKSGNAMYLNSPIMPGTKFSFEMQGISGFTFLGQFTVDHVPTPYNYKNCVWQVCDIKHEIKSGNWITKITADCRPISFVEN